LTKTSTHSTLKETAWFVQSGENKSVKLLHADTQRSPSFSTITSQFL